MNNYTNKISLVQNARGCWDLDPFKGCYNGTISNKNGCYGICYAQRIAKFRGYDFTKVVYRDFESDKHLKEIGEKLQSIPFVRLGVMCDPSYDWEHTIKIIEKISQYISNIVIVTKHWNVLTNDQLVKLLKIKGVCINTSVSALDTDEQLELRMAQYEKLKKFCKSVLRVNTCDFVEPSMIARQMYLLRNDNVIDNILRIPKSSKLVKYGIVKVTGEKFLSSSTSVSRNSRSTYFSYCKDCPDQCGIKT